jgi:S-formylglutathione hydrolase FrmB
MAPILGLNIVDGTVLAVLAVLSLSCLGYLVSHRSRARKIDDAQPSERRQTRRWMLRVAIGFTGGLVAGLGVIFVTEVVLNSFGTPMETDTNVWAVAAFAASGIAVINLWKSRWWRKVVAALAIVMFFATSTVAINAGYGLNTTLASLFNITVSHPVALPSHSPVPATVAPAVVIPPKPLWERWVAPAGMPAVGTFGTVIIPPTASGFVARPAYLYLPPAALVTNPPPLPILIMMMGQPGGPESAALFVDTLNAQAAAHGGLAPIVLTVDQIGSPTQNPLCIDSVHGKTRTYVMTDVIDYVRANLHVSTERTDWAVGGYSNGGECALSFGARYPGIFGSIFDISGEIGPSLGTPALTLKQGFGGDQAFYDSEQPLNILKQNTYTDTLAIFTSGTKDAYYSAEVTTAEVAAGAAGMVTHRFIGQGVGHRSDAIKFGFPAGLPLLYQRWKLAQ